MQTTNTGKLGESLAAKALEKAGYTILARNWKTKISEIDIVAEKDGTMCFVEVKYCRTEDQGDGFDYITRQKLLHMNRAAEQWIIRNDWKGEHVLLAAAVTGNGKTLDIREVA